MERIVLTVVALSVFAACAEPVGFWRFEDGGAGERAGNVASTVGGPTRMGKAGLFEKGSLPVYAQVVAFADLWDSVAEQPTAEKNRLSMCFTAPEAVGGAAPVGAEVVVSGKDAAVKPESFTLEAYVKIGKRTARHALIASKRRNGQAGASWSLSIMPPGTLGVRFDTEQKSDGGRIGVFNQCFGGAPVPEDGAWHHVALTFDVRTRQALLYLDHTACGGGTVASALVYDDSDLVIGRGLDGWLDEVRLSPAALHPEQFLRPTRFFSEMKPKTAPALPLLDQTATRVQSALKPDLRKLGTLIPKSVPALDTPMWSLGCETLDRDLANWDAYRGYLVPLGIRRIRL